MPIYTENLSNEICLCFTSLTTRADFCLKLFSISFPNIHLNFANIFSIGLLNICLVTFLSLKSKYLVHIL